MNLYFDSAYVATCYVNEPDSTPIRRVARDADQLCSSIWCLPEVACVFHRHVRETSLSVEQAGRLQKAFRLDRENGVWHVLPVTEDLLRRVEALVPKLPSSLLVRAGDAVHLVSARDAGFHDIWSNDRRLLAAAPYFDLKGRTA